MLQDEWIKENGLASDTPLDNEIAKRLKKFKNMTYLKKAALQVLAKSLSRTQLEGLQHIFKQMDVDGNGTVTMDELGQGLLQMDCSLAESQISEVMKQVDFDGNGVNDHDEFIAATLLLNRLTEEANLMNAFRNFDADGDGAITLDELKVYHHPP